MSVFVHIKTSETLDSCRFEKMRQNAPNPISISIFFRGYTPDPRHWELCSQTPGEGREGKGWKGKGREREREGEWKFASLPLGDRRPWSGGRRGEARRAESGDGVFGEATANVSPPARGLRERCKCKLPQRGPGRSPARRSVFLYSVPSDCLSQHLSTCCIQFAWLGIRFF